MLVLLLFFGVLFPLFFYSLKMVTEVRKEGLYIRFYPLHFSMKVLPCTFIFCACYSKNFICVLSIG
ncbi:MAG: DUF6141 family protein [Euryarchaeota archaeon]|nr:DUF6141 family protein [Euryarchaeota archaeon]